MTKRTTKICRCGTTFHPRTADIKRGWGKFCSKSCKATEQEQRTHQHYNYRNSGVSRKEFKHYQQEHGGAPHFHPVTGEYEGFTGHFSDSEHDCNKE
jgi:hypothetical protein